MTKQNKKYISLILLSVIVAVVSIIVLNYKFSPKAVVYDKKTGNMTTRYDMLAQQNLAEKTVYYRMRYQWFLAGENGDVERQATHYTTRDHLVISPDEFNSELPILKEKILKQFEEENNPRRKVIASSLRIMRPIQRLACYKNFDKKYGLMACFNGVDSVPQIIKP